MFFLLLLTIRVHSESSIWIDLWWSVREHSNHDLFFLCSVCYSSLDICSLFEVSFLYFLLFMSPVFLLGWSSALVPSKLTGILINDYHKNIQLPISEMLKKVSVHAWSREPSLSGRLKSFSKCLKSFGRVFWQLLRQVVR